MLLLLCVALGNVALSNNANAQAMPTLKSLKVQVGKQPIAIIPAKKDGGFEINPDTLNIICLGWDANYMGLYDQEGDEFPSWWKIERVVDANPFNENPQSYTARKIMDFDVSNYNWEGFFPFRNRIPEAQDGGGISIFTGNLLPVAFQDKIIYYDLSSEQPIHTIEAANVKSVCSYGEFVFTTSRGYDSDWNSTSELSMYVYVSMPPLFEGFQKVFSYESENKMIQRVIAYESNVDGDSKFVIAVLYEGEGPWGSLVNSTIEFHTLKTDDITPEMSWEDCFDIKTINVGYNANDMVLLNIGSIYPYLLVVSSGDNGIYAVDGIDYEVDEEYMQIPCEAPNSIREVSLKINDNFSISATISSYDGYLYYIHNIFNYDPDALEEPNYNYFDSIAYIIYPNFKIKSDNAIWSDASYLFNNISKNNVVFARTLNMNENYLPENEVEIFYVKWLTGILEINNSLKVFPNPVEDIVNVELEDMSEIVSIRLINNEGKYIQSLNNYSVNGNIVQINIPNIPIGNYLIRIDTKQGTYIQKVIVK